MLKVNFNSKYIYLHGTHVKQIQTQIHIQQCGIQVIQIVKKIHIAS